MYIDSSRNGNFTQMFLRNALFILAYFIFGKVGLLLGATGGGYAAPVWMPTGIAFAAVLIWGWEILPGVWIGAFLTNLSISASAGPLVSQAFVVSAFIATGNTLEAAVSRLFLARFY